MPQGAPGPQVTTPFAANEPVPMPGEWGGIVPDPRLVAAIVDRVTFNAHIIETGNESYRLRTTKARAGRDDGAKGAK
jgi:hypothetical protein